MLNINGPRFHDRITLRHYKRTWESLRGPDSPLGDTEKLIEKRLRALPNPSKRETQDIQTVERDHALLKALGEVSSFLQMQLDLRQTPSITNQMVGNRRRTISIFDSFIAELQDLIMAKKYLDHEPKSYVTLSAEVEPRAKRSLLKRPIRLIPITNGIEQDISWVLTTTMHKVSPYLT